MSASRKKSAENKQKLMKQQNVLESRLRDLEKLRIGIAAELRSTSKKFDEAVKAGSDTQKILATEIVKLNNQINTIELHCSNIRMFKNEMGIKKVTEDTLSDLNDLNAILSDMAITDIKEVTKVIAKTERLMANSSKGEQVINTSMTTVATVGVSEEEVNQMVNDRVKTNDEDMLALINALPNVPQKQKQSITVSEKQNVQNK